MTSQAQQSLTDSKITKTFKCIEIGKQICKNLRTFHERKEFYDLILIANNGIQVQAHQILLCASSEYFKKTIHRTDKTKSPMEIEVKEFNSFTLESVLQFMYTSFAKLTMETVKEVLGAADQFKMQPLMDLCFSFMTQELNSSNWSDTIMFAKEHGYLEVYETSFSFVCFRFEEISSGIDFLQLDQEMLDDILSSDNLAVSSEEKIVHSLLKWLEHKKQDREEDWETRLSNVRYQFLTDRFIAENSDRLCINLKSHKLIRCWLEWHLLPEKRSQNQIALFKPRKAYQTLKLVLVSGWCLDGLELKTYYPEFNTWDYEEIPSLWDNVTRFSAIIDKGLVLITGGIKKDNTKTNEVKYFNIETEDKGLLPSMRECRSTHLSAVLNGYLYVIGGQGIYDNELVNLKSVERYDFEERKWEDVPPLLEPVYDGKAAVVNDCLYVVTSNFTQCYNPNDNRWSRKTPKSEKSDLFGLVSCSGYLFTIGGRLNDWQFRDTVERYKPSSDTWDVVTSLRSPRCQSMCLVFNNSFIVVGASYNSECESTVEKYNTKTNKWKTLASVVP